MKRVGIDSWQNRAFSIEIYPAVASKCLKELGHGPPLLFLCTFYMGIHLIL